MENGFFVSFPFGDNAPYDLIVDNGIRLYKVQSKTAHIIADGQIEVPFERRVGYKRIATQSYQELNVDFICAYCPQYDKVFLLDLKKFTNTSKLLLRVSLPLNNMRKGVNFAEDYLFEKQVKNYIT